MRDGIVSVYIAVWRFVYSHNYYWSDLSCEQNFVLLFTMLYSSFYMYQIKLLYGLQN